MALPAGLIARELSKFVAPQSAGTEAAVAVTNPDGSNIFGGSPIGIQSLPSINGTVSFGGVISLASGQFIGIAANSSLPSIQGSVAVNNLPGIISLASGQFIGIAANSSLPSINGTVGLAPNQTIALASQANFIGGVSIYGNINVAQGITSLASGQFIGLNPTTNYIGLASINGNVNASVASITGNVAIVNTLISLASGQFIGIGANSSLPSINGTVAISSMAGLMSLPSGQYIGIAVNSSLPSIYGLVGNAAGTNFIGLVSTASINGTVTLANGSLPSINGVVSLQPNTNSGWSKYSFLSLATGAQQIKSSQGELGGWFVGNPNAQIAYVSIFDIANSSVSLGVRVPDLIMTIPANGAANMEAANGIQFSTAIQIAASMTPLGGSGPSIGLPVSFWYK